MTQDWTTNHVATPFSELDKEMARHIPPGGNWKNIPETVPSQRLKQIRESYAKGGGSRSTYYGRLHPDKPAYTISTYFSRIGNGCHLHPVADRLITVREGARIQSFPDGYHFEGARGHLYTQVGNALPPILAYQLASVLKPTSFIDLFAGAGGMTLGFAATGARPLLDADNNKWACATLRANRTEEEAPVIESDLTSAAGKEHVLRAVKEAGEKPDAVIGGPPCQGFSHAGNARTIDDPRNACVGHFIDLVGQIKPRIVVMENVPGLKTMEGGRVLNDIKRAFASVGYPVSQLELQAERYGIPQKRTRIFLVALRDEAAPIEVPPTTASTPVAVREALGDLPTEPASLPAAQVEYCAPADSPYKKYLRGQLSLSDYVGKLKAAPVVSRQARLNS